MKSFGEVISLHLGSAGTGKFIFEQVDFLIAQDLHLRDLHFYGLQYLPFVAPFLTCFTHSQ